MLPPPANSQFYAFPPGGGLSASHPPSFCVLWGQQTQIERGIVIIIIVIIIIIIIGIMGLNKRGELVQGKAFSGEGSNRNVCGCG